jgi:hypothetical protein
MPLPQAELLQQQQMFFARMEAHFRRADSLQQQLIGDSNEAGSSVLAGRVPSARANTPQECSDAASGPVSSSSPSPAQSAAGAVLHDQLNYDYPGARTRREEQGICSNSSDSGSNSQNVVSAASSSIGIQNSIAPIIVHFSAVAATVNDEAVETRSCVTGSSLMGSAASMATADLKGLSKRLVAIPDNDAEHVRTDALEQFGNA